MVKLRVMMIVVPEVDLKQTNKRKVRLPVNAAPCLVVLSFSINVVISSFIECMPVESPFPHASPQILCVCVWGWGWRGWWGCKRVSVYVSEWVCVFAVPIYFHVFPLAFVLVNDLFFWFLVVFVLEIRTMLFLFLFVSFCCMHLYFMFTAVSYQMFFHWCSFMYPHWGFWNKPLVHGPTRSDTH